MAGAAPGGGTRAPHADFYAPPAVPNRASTVRSARIGERGHAGRSDRPPSTGRTNRRWACPFNHAAALPRHAGHDLLIDAPADLPRSAPAGGVIGDHGTAGLPAACVARIDRDANAYKPDRRLWAAG